MNIAEAVEIRRHWRKHPPALVVAAAQMIVDEHLRITDPTPLTREVIEAELSASGIKATIGLNWISWRLGRSKFELNPGGLFLGAQRVKFDPTLGHLRQIVAMLRVGVK